MSRIDVPDGRDPLLHLWSGTGNELTGPAAAFSDAVYRKSTLPLREFEAARITIARINDCRICLSLRPEGDLGQAFYDAVLGDGAGLTEREALAAEFAHRFAIDHPARAGSPSPTSRCCNRLAVRMRERNSQ